MREEGREEREREEERGERRGGERGGERERERERERRRERETEGEREREGRGGREDSERIKIRLAPSRGRNSEAVITLGWRKERTQTAPTHTEVHSRLGYTHST